MAKHFQREMDKLNEELAVLCEKVQTSFKNASLAFQEQNIELARTVSMADNEIDEAEVAFEENCLKILALYQPVAKDLRMLVASLKINNDLERIADLAVNFANRSVYIFERGYMDQFFDFSEMITCVQEMLVESVQSLLQLDLALAKQVWRKDPKINEIHRGMYQWVNKKIQEQPERAEFFISQLSLSRYLERIADYTTNIAEDVIYLIDGSIVRHRPEEFE